MSALDILRSLLRAARVRVAWISIARSLAVALPLLLAATRFGTPAAPPAALALAALAITAMAVVAARRLDAPWAARRLDALDPALDDSSALLLVGPDGLGPLQSLQRQRVAARVAARADLDLRPSWPTRQLALLWAGAAIAIGALLLVGNRDSTPASTSMPTEAPAPTAPAHTVIVRHRVDIVAPAYTGRAARQVDALDLSVEEGASVRWQLGLAPPPAAAKLVFSDGSTLPLARAGDDWVGARPITAALLYHLETEGVPPLADGRSRRIELIPDRPPQIRVLVPEKTLSLVEPPQPKWTLLFEAEDDYGLGAASLTVTVAHGSGENVEVKEQVLQLPGEGDARRRRYPVTLDLAALGLAAGDDLIARLAVVDQRTPAPNRSRSASYILRWPPPTGDAGTGMEGLVQRQLPAYFRSQRQIIIDTEALLAERPRLAADEYGRRANQIGEDQKALRLRYGQFLGEESEDRAGPDGEQHHDEGPAGHDEHAAPAAFGVAGDVVAQYGHVHDIAEAATLLDPETKKLLRGALDAMWRAEEQLRLAQLPAALPHENRALGFIKQVQQASRIYLARVGLELPAIDTTRRLSGDRKSLADRGSTMTAASVDATPTAAWQALDAGMSPDFGALADWSRAHPDASPDALGLAVAIERVQQEPACADCRAELSRQLWPLLPRAAAGARQRPMPDAAGRAYLDALAKEAAR